MALAAQIAALGAQMDRKISKFMNASALLGNHALEEIAGPGNVLPSAMVPPVWFPATRTELDTLTGPRGERDKAHVLSSIEASLSTFTLCGFLSHK